MADILAFIQSYPTVWSAIKLVLTALLAFIVVYAVLRLEKKVSKKLIAKRNNINLRFVENVVRFIVIFLAVQWVVMSSDLTEPFGRVLFQGTTVIAAIAGFAAQPVIADMICGLMLSVTKPFDIGDRIELEDGRAGIVKDITLRHVTLQEIDTLLLVIPNSKLNGMKITNMSQLRPKRSVHFRFHVAYNADVDRAMAVIADAVRQSPYTVPQTTDGQYAPVYFISYGESSLVMATTVYYEPTSRTEVMKSDVNLRVRHALNEAGIEIPYNYVNVVMHEAK
ncbi:MAG: mechanosensitive ion channel family protein [Clostridia bacterium]|nr:mechanosensitive ion channel family protein [Clostridia bacterium]